MATEVDHIAFANRTHKTIKLLLSDSQTHSPWIAIAAFYKALHVAEAVFAADRKHCGNHGEREVLLKTTRKYEKICEHYLPLSRASTIARYLVTHQCFDTYLTADKVISQLLKHELTQVEKSAVKFLTDPASLILIGEAFT